MEISGSDGNHLSLRISGYQFADSADVRKRFSWHMVNGSVNCAEGDWKFEWQALACDESARVSRWLRAVASASLDGLDLPSPLVFTEPNLRFDAARTLCDVTVSVWFDLEFQPPWRARRGAGDPYLVEFKVTAFQLTAAADEWDIDVAAFPDGLAS